MTRRQFLTRYMPGLALLPLAQYDHVEELPPPGADTPVNLTMRVTALEVGRAIDRAVDVEQGKLIRWLCNQVRNPGDWWGDRDRAT